MASVINTNMASLYAQKNLSGAQNALSTSVERLSSGLRINRAKDDAAGLGISEKLKSQIVSLNQGIRNANDAISMVQTAESSLSEVSSILQRMKELTVQGRNESLSGVQRTYIADELIALKQEVNAIAERTSFNGMSLLKNALRTQVASTSNGTNNLVPGSNLIDGIRVDSIDVSGANVGSYTLQTRSVNLINAASNVNEAVTGQALRARTVTINEGDVFEGSELKIVINGQEYSVVAGQDSSASSLATQLVSKLNRDYSGSVSASTNTVIFASGASLGNADIQIVAGERSPSQIVGDVRSTVDAPFSNVSHERTIVLNDHDIVEGRKVTIRVGNPNEVATFSTVIGAGATKQNIAEDLAQLIDNQFSNVSVSDSKITFSAAASLGMSEMSITFEDTTTNPLNLTLSTVTSKYGAESNRVIEINENDLEVDRVISLSVNGKEYAYKVMDGDTANTVANKLSGLLDDDYATVAGVVTTPGVSVTDGVPGTESAAITFKALRAGEAITVAGLKFTATADMADTAVAGAFVSLANGATTGPAAASGTYSGTLAGYTSGSATGAVVTFTSTTTNSDVSDINVVQTGRVSSTVVTYNAGAANTSTYAFTLSGLNSGGSIQLGNLTFTAARDLTLAETISAFENLTSTPTSLSAGGELLGTYSGTLTGAAAGTWTSGAAVGGVITFTDSAATNAEFDTTPTVTLTARVSDPDDVVTTVTDGAGGSTTESATVTFGAAGMKAGDTVTVGGLRFTASATLTQAEVAAAFASLYDGATYGTGIEYGTYEGELRGYSSGTVQAGGQVVFTSVATDGTNVKNLTASANAVSVQVQTSNNQITLTNTGAKLGLADINLKVQEVSGAGEFVLTAGSDTGIGGLSQAISFGNLAAGSAKSLVFDQLGIKVTLSNNGNSSVGSTQFELYENQASTLVVASAMNGEALFQVGAAVRDTVVIDGFKDIRITGASKNGTQAEREVFNNLHTTLTAISAGEVDEATFATLETQVEDAITTVSTFRSYLGAQQNRIDYAIANLQAQSENITDANSRIRDTDYAAETANLTKTQIMQQAATAMLAQANQMPNVILALLK